MSNSSTLPQPPSDDDERRRRADLEEIEITERKFSLAIKKEEQRLAPLYRVLTLVIVWTSIIGICWIVREILADRKEVAMRRIEADILIAELQAKTAIAAQTAPAQSAPSLASLPDVSTKARDAFEDAVKVSIAQENKPSTAARVFTTASSILDQLVKTGKATKAEAAAITNDLMKAGIDVTKDVLTEFGKTGVHLLLDDKKEANGKSGMSIAGNVVNYLSCAAPAGKKATEPTPLPSSPNAPKKRQKPAVCPTTTEKLAFR
ncbi:hypothetical protein [Cupriavidus necator]